MSNKFTEFIRNEVPQDRRMPLFHTTNGWTLREVLGQNKLEPQPCNVFKGESLVYLFYGRPAYRVDSGELSTSLYASLPVCFVLKPDCISSIERIFPFDSGAFHGKSFTDYIPAEMTLDHFSLEPALHIPPRVVRAFFGSNESYYQGKALDSIPHDPLEFEVQCYHELIKSRGETEYDDRRSTIEVQSKIAVNLSRDTILAVVIPLVFMDAPEIRETIVGEWRAEILAYNLYHMSTQEYTGQILTLIRDYLKKERYM